MARTHGRSPSPDSTDAALVKRLKTSHASFVTNGAVHSSVGAGSGPGSSVSATASTSTLIGNGNGNGTVSGAGNGHGMVSAGVDGDPTPQFAGNLFDHNHIAKLHSGYLTNQPFKYAVVEKLFQDELLKKVKDECLSELNFTEKETDIYKVGLAIPGAVLLLLL